VRREYVALGAYGILECVSFSLCRFSLSVSRIPSGHWQVKISRDSALQSSKSSLCRVHSWPAPQISPALAPCLPPFALRCGGRRLRIRPVTEAPLVCASLLVATHRAPARPLSLASQLHAQPRLIVSFCACALPHHTPWALTPQVLQQWRFLSPASKLDAGAYHGVSRPHPSSPSSTRSTPTRWICTTWPSLAVTAHLALSCRHTLSGPVSSARYTSLSVPSTVCYPQLVIASLCFLAPSRSSEMAAS
jgi:hypothetical protein